MPFSSLGAEDKARVGKLLDDRLQALRSLADRHPGTPIAALLTAAAVEPPEDAVYAINGQPVIVGWGRQGGHRHITPPPAAPMAVAPPPDRRSGFPWLLVAALAALALLAVLLWWLWPFGMGKGGAEDRLAALAAEETALHAEITAAEAELRRRLDACTTAAPPLPPPASPEIQVPPTPEPKSAAIPPQPPTPPLRAAEKPETKKAEAAPLPPPEPKAKAAPACPPPRKKWEAPELVMMLDASGSMRLKAGISQEEIRALTRRANAGDRAALAQLRALESGGGDRLSAAKAAVSSMLSRLPGDVDVGLVVFGQCKGAENHKFFSPAERPRLNALLDGIRPMEGTPLARGIERAGSLVDGQSVPATIVIVTDGEDSCGGDPCAAARALKAAKPKVTINVIDVNGQGKGRCIAEATGGRVLPMTSPAELPELMRKASGEQPVPPGCGG